MTDPRHRLAITLRRLAFALLDATVLLLIALCIAIIVVIGRVQGFAADTAVATRDALGPAMAGRLSDDLDRLTETTETLRSIDARLASLQENAQLDASVTHPEFAALRAELATVADRVIGISARLDEIRALGAGSARALAERVVAALATFTLSKAGN